MSYQLSEMRESVNGGRQRTQLVVADDEDPQEWELEHRWGQTGQKVATVKMSKHRSASLGVKVRPRRTWTFDRNNTARHFTERGQAASTRTLVAS